MLIEDLPNWTPLWAAVRVWGEGVMLRSGVGWVSGRVCFIGWSNL